MHQRHSSRTFFALLVAIASVGSYAYAAPFASGNIVVYRIGTGVSAPTSASTAVFIDEYTPSGTLVQSIALPTAASAGINPLTASGSVSGEGLLSRSADGRFLVLSGYAAAPGVASIAGTSATITPRVVGLIDATGAINTSTALTDFSTANNARSATSLDGTQVWVAGAGGGLRYATIGASTSTQLSTTLSNLRQLEIFAGQLYVDTSSGTAVRIGAVGSGTPTVTGQTISNLPGITLSGSPYAFALVHLGTSVAGLNTLYVADDALGVLKYSFNGSTWTASGSAGGKYRGLIASTSGDTVTVFMSIDGELDTLSDSSGFNGTLSAMPAKIASAVTDTLMRGVAFAPKNPVVAVPHASVSTPFDFGSINIGASSSAQAITLSNDGNADLHVSTVTPSGDFQVSSETCSGAPIAASITCTINVQFSPTVAGAAAAVCPSPAIPAWISKRPHRIRSTPIASTSQARTVTRKKAIANRTASAFSRPI